MFKKQNNELQKYCDISRKNTSDAVGSTALLQGTRKNKNRWLNEDFTQNAIILIIALFSACCVLASLIFPYFKMYEEISIVGTLIAFVATIAYAVCLFCVSQLISLRVLKGMIAWLVFLVSVCQLLIAFNMQLVPNVDLVHIYEQVMKMFENNSKAITDIDYFGYFPNNIPVTILIYWVFRFGKAIGITNYRLTGGLFNVLCIWISWFYLYRLAKEKYGQERALFFVGILVVNPLFLAYASYYYTDTTSLPFLAGAAYYLLHESKENSSFIKSVSSYILGGFLLAAAMKLRITSIFFGLAILTYMLVKRLYIKKIKCLVAVLMGFLCFQLLFSPVYRMHVPFDTYDTAVPATHFIMMGVSDDGTHNGEDVLFTQSFPTHEEKVENTLRVIKERIKNRGVLGNIKLIILKEAQVWGIGPHGFPQYTEYVTEKNIIYDLFRGNKSNWFFCYTQGYNAAFFLMLLLSIIMSRKEFFSFQQIIGIYLIGAVVFYIFWEAHSRHAFITLVMSTYLLIPPNGFICPFRRKQ